MSTLENAEFELASLPNLGLAKVALSAINKVTLEQRSNLRSKELDVPTADLVNEVIHRLAGIAMRLIGAPPQDRAGEDAASFILEIAAKVSLHWEAGSWKKD